MLKISAIILLLLSPSSSTFQPSRSTESATQPDQSSSLSHELPTLNYCALMKGKHRYSGKQVRVNASWQFAFETTFLFDRDCPKQPGAWLEFVDDSKSCPETKKNRDAPGPHDKEAEVTVTGRLIGPGRFGHLGAYPYKFVVTCLEKIKITGSDLK